MSGTTPFPNALIDDLMPRLKDTEWRLLCVIVRQTLGWQDKNTRRRKVRDWITQAQFVQKTGRDRAAISRALDSLVKDGYIEVHSEADRLLHSPEERRQYKGRLFYGLSARLLKDSRVIAPRAKSEYQGPPSNSLLKREISKSEYWPAPKANTTKETLTKENDTKAVLIKKQVFIKKQALISSEAPTEAAPGQEHMSSSDAFLGDPSQQGHKACASQTMGSQPMRDHTMNAFLDLFGKLSTELLGYAADTNLAPAECPRLATFLEKTPHTHWRTLLQAYFQSELEYVKRHKYAISALANTCNIFLIQRQTNRPIERTVSSQNKGEDTSLRDAIQ